MTTKEQNEKYWKTYRISGLDIIVVTGSADEALQNALGVAKAPPRDDGDPRLALAQGEWPDEGCDIKVSAQNIDNAEDALVQTAHIPSVEETRDALREEMMPKLYMAKTCGKRGEAIIFKALKHDDAIHQAHCWVMGMGIHSGPDSALHIFQCDERGEPVPHPVEPSGEILYQSQSETVVRKDGRYFHQNDDGWRQLSPEEAWAYAAAYSQHMPDSESLFRCAQCGGVYDADRKTPFGS
jgi:hypothetical protein